MPPHAARHKRPLGSACPGEDSLIVVANEGSKAGTAAARPSAPGHSTLSQRSTGGAAPICFLHKRRFPVGEVRSCFWSSPARPSQPPPTLDAPVSSSSGVGVSWVACMTRSEHARSAVVGHADEHQTGAGRDLRIDGPGRLSLGPTAQHEQSSAVSLVERGPMFDGRGVPPNPSLQRRQTGIRPSAPLNSYAVRRHKKRSWLG